MKISHTVLISAALAAIIVAVCVAFVPQDKAEAAPLSASVTTHGITSVPCVTNVEHMSGNKYILEITVAGRTAGKQLVVKKANNTKKLRVYQIDQHTWSIEVKKGTRYVISFDGKAIEYKLRKGV